MAKTLDLNKLKRPTLPLVMPDAAKTVINVTTPAEVLIRELESTLPELQTVLAKGDEYAVKTSYDLIARLLSYNLEHITITPDELTNKYKLSMDHLVAIMAAYVDFIEELHNSKN